MIIQNTTVSPPAQTNDAPKVVTKPANTAPETTANLKQAASQAPSPEQLKSAVDIINSVIRQSNNNLEFSLDNDTNKPIVRLVDTETGELIRQYPSEETLAISRSIDRFQQGFLLKQEA